MRQALTIVVFACICATQAVAAEHGIPPSEAAKRQAIEQGIVAWQASHSSKTATSAPAPGSTNLSALTAATSAATGAPPDVTTVTSDAQVGGVPRWNRIELTIASQTSGSAFVYETDRALGGVDLSATFTLGTSESWTVNGFYDGAAWKVRFAPDAVGTWTYTVTDGVSTSPPASFTCVASTGKHGWARINGTNLRFSDGAAFYGLGHNTGWLYDVETPSMSVMRANGENCLSFWMSSPWAMVADDPNQANELVLPARAPLETVQTGLGAYNQAACAYLDGVVARAESAGMYLVPSLWAHDELQDATSWWGARNWSNNAYSTVCPNGVPDFFRLQDTSGDTPSWHHQKNRYRYILSRWGYSTAIVGWVGVVEIDGVLPYHTAAGYAVEAADAKAWALAVRSWFSAHDGYRTLAGAYPFVVTKSDEASSDATTYPQFLDLVACDQYLSKKSNYTTASAQGPASVIANEDAQMMATGKPCFHTEFGGEIGAGSGATQPTHLHHGLWAGLCSGDAICPMLWTDGGQYPLVDPATVPGSAMLNHYRYLSTFVRALPLLGDPRLVKATPTYSVSGLAGFGRRLGGATGNWGFIWTQSVNGAQIVGGTLKQTGLAEGRYTVEWFNPWTGARVAPATTVSTAKVNIGNKRTPVYEVRLDLAIPATTGATDLAVRFGSDANNVPAIVSPVMILAQAETDDAQGPSSAPIATGNGAAPRPHHCGLGGGLAGVMFGFALMLRLRSRR